MAEQFNGSNDEDAVLDQRLKLALMDVPLPEGLAERLKQAVRTQAAAHQLTNASASDSPATLAMAAHSDSDQQSGQYVRRGALVALFAAAVCGFAWVAHQWQQPAEKSWLVAHSQTIIGKWEADNPANMQFTQTALGELPEAVRSQLMKLNLLATRDLAGLDKRWSGQLLRLDAGDGRAVVLLKLPKLPTVRGLNGRFELLPTASGAWSLAALTVREETYVLAANCTQQQLLQYIRRAAVT